MPTLAWLSGTPGARQHLHGPLRHERADPVVDAAARQDDLRLVAQLLGLAGQVVRIDADAVAADQAGREAQEVPLGAGRLEHVLGADAQPVEDERQLVHERDVEVALRVLDHLGRLGHLDRRGPVDAGGDHRAVGVGDAVEGGRVLPGHDLGDALEGVLAVARVDALGRVAEREVHAAAQPGDLLEDRAAHLLGRARVDRGLEDHDRALLDHLADALGGGHQRAEVRPEVLVDRRRHRDHEEGGAAQVLELGGEAQRRRAQLLGAGLAGVVLSLGQERRPGAR